MNAAIVQEVEHAAIQPRDGGSKPTSPLHSLLVKPIPFAAARDLLVAHHYLHSLPGGTKMAFGVFKEDQLMGALTLGSGPTLSYCLVERATANDCLTLTRLWLSDELPGNSESRVLSIVVRALRKSTSVKFLVSYADPSQGHLGTIYQASGWLYTGLSEAMPLYDLGDGVARHSRSIAHSYGTHSRKHFARHGVQVKLVPQAAKHRYVYFLDPTWRCRLTPQVLPYPKKEHSNERD